MPHMQIKGQFPLAIVVIELVAIAVLHVAGFILATVFIGGVYAVSCRLNPRVRHRSGFRHCNGAGEIRSWLFPWTFHRCPNCAGGRQIRFGARYIGAPDIRAEHERTVAARKRAKERRGWR
jgi:hypothetical protein